MGNKIKTSGVTTKQVTTRNTNFSIGVDGFDDYGPTSITGFYNGINPPLSGYTIYVHKNSGGPSIHVANNDSECIFFLKSFGATGSTINEVLAWSTGRTDMWVQTELITTLSTFTNPSFTVGSAVTIESVSPFSGGGNSYRFYSANANSYIDVPASSDWAVGTGDFTIEWFQYTTTTTVPPYQRVFTVDDFPSMDIGVSNEGGTFYYWANSSFRYSSTSAISINTWEHWAVVRQSGVTKVYKDGTLRGSQFSDTNDITNTVDPLTIGADNAHATNATFVGYITNFRWVKGLAVYTGNFTKPTSALTATANANPYGGSNTQAIGSGYTKLLLVP